MTELEKVYEGLECCAVGAECDHCPYSQMNEGKGDYTGCHQLHWDALELLKEQQWIPVSERLPEEKQNPLTHDFDEVICYCTFGAVPKADDVRFYKFGRGHFYHGSQIMDQYVTHWMYKPEPPKENDHE